MLERARRYLANVSKVVQDGSSYLRDPRALFDSLGEWSLAQAKKAIGTVLRRLDLGGLGPTWATDPATWARPPPAEPRAPAKDTVRAPNRARKRAEASSHARQLSGPGLPPLSGQPKLHGTVWLPRILWGMAWAERAATAPVNAAEIAEILSQHGGLQVAGPNVARAFRELRDRAEVQHLWTEPRPLHYQISAEGLAALQSVTP